MRKFLVIIEPSASGFAAYCPDLPGCVATGATRAEVESTIREAIEFHLDGMREEGLEVPERGSYATIVEVAAAAS